jgi:GNAT superfamily N-acetyltransferase
MELREITTKEEMLRNFELLHEFYPSITLEEYDKELDLMIPNNYGQVGMYEGDECIGMSGYWIGSKLWCGKYLECDNVVVSSEHRRKGIANKIFEYLREKAEKEGCTMMALDSYTDNFDAHKFFMNEGFVPRGFHFINVLKPEKIR